MSKQSPPPPPTYDDLIRETARLLSSNRRHFLNLSLLFLLPQSLFITIFFGLMILHPKVPTIASTILILTCAAISFIVSLLAYGSISFSSYNLLLGRPIKLILSIHSLLRSFPRLLITALAFLLINFLVLFALVLLAGAVMMIERVVFEIDESSLFFVYLTGINIIVLGYIIAVSFMPLLKMINLAISCVIVVIESKQGFEPLRRSAQLMKENKQALSQLMHSIGIILLGNMYSIFYLIKLVNGDARSLLFVLGIAVNTGICMMSMLVHIVAITVLYCKVAGEYSSLSLVDDDEKVARDDSHVIPSSKIGMA